MEEERIEHFVFAGSRDIFDSWAKNNHYLRYNDCSFYVSRYNGNKHIVNVYKYITLPEALRGVNKGGNIVLLRDWDNKHRAGKIIEINYLFMFGSKVIGEKKDVFEEDWDAFQRAHNLYVFKEKNDFHQDWFFDKAENRFSLIEI